MQRDPNSNQKQVRRWTNHRAVQWALKQEGMSTAEKCALVSFAEHADHRGYSWPSVDHIAFTWQLHPRTVRGAIRALLVRRKLCRTKKRRGWTGQVRVYRLPKCTYESRLQTAPFENDNNRDKGDTKQALSRLQMPPNNGIMKKVHHSELIILGNSVPTPPVKQGSSDFVVEGHQHQSQSVRDHIKWPEYATWCASQAGKRGKDGRVHDGIGTEDGFWKWMLSQKPQWRNKRKQPDKIDGFDLHGKFYTHAEAIQMMINDPEIFERFTPAVNRHGKIIKIKQT
jgi:hypothetical protein